MLEIGILRQNMANLLRRTAVDEEFRRACLEDAAAAYLSLTGQPLPERYEVRFAEPEREIKADSGARWVRLPPLLPRTWLDGGV